MKYLILLLMIGCQLPDPVTVTQYRYSQKTDQCLVRSYKFDVDFVGPLERSKEVPLEECYSLVGYKITDYAKIVSWQQDIIDIVRKKINKFSAPITGSVTGEYLED